MRVTPVHFDPMRAFGSNGVLLQRLVRAGEVSGFAVDVLQLAPGAVLGRHPAPVWQLFAVVTGSGWVSGRAEERHAVSAGSVVVWEPGEEHESGSDAGMLAVVVQSPVDPMADPS